VCAEVPYVAIQIDDDLAADDGKSAPHRVPLAFDRAQLRQEAPLVDHFGTGRSGKLAGSVSGVGVDDEHLIDETQILELDDGIDSCGDRRCRLPGGDADRHQLALKGKNPAGRELRMAEGG